MVLDVLNKELKLCMDTLDIKKNFSVIFNFNDFAKTGFGNMRGGNELRKITASERLPVNIVTADNSIVINPSLPVPS